VQILEHNKRRAATRRQHPQQRVEDPPSALAAFEQASQIAPHRGGDIDQHTECPRRHQRITRTHENPDISVVQGRELLHKHRLPNPSLTTDKNKPTAAPDRVLEQIRQNLKGTLTLDQRHRVIVTRPQQKRNSHGEPNPAKPLVERVGSCPTSLQID
jgi:hypothetical protein